MRRYKKGDLNEAIECLTDILSEASEDELREILSDNVFEELAERGRKAVQQALKKFDEHEKDGD